MKKIILSSCGIIDENLKKHFYKLLNKDIEKVKLLFIKIAADGELDPDRTWIDEEYNSILDLGILEENISIYEYDKGMELNKYDIIYMLGGNTFYLMKELRLKGIDKDIINAINEGVIYVGSSAGSVIMGENIETSLPYDENWVELDDFCGLHYVDGNVIPHANRKQDYIKTLKNKNIIELYDDYGIVIEENVIYNYNVYND